MRMLTRFVATLATTTLLAGSAFAQTVVYPANLDFETWAPRTTAPTSVEAPTGWISDDDIFSGGGPTGFGTLTKTTDKHSGTFAARLTTDASGYGSFLALGTNRGIYQLPYVGGVPFTGRPTNFSFYYKISNAAAASDSAYAFLALTSYASGSKQLVGLAEIVLDSAATTYSRASTAIQYASTTAMPDSAYVVFSSGIAFNLTPNNSLFIDEVNIGQAITTGTRNSQLNAAVSVYPNPSLNGRFVLSASELALLAAPLTVTDVTGRVVLQRAAASPASSRELDLSAQKAGIYTLQLQTEKGVAVRKLVIQ